MTSNPTRADRLFEIGSAYRQAKVLLSAVELGVFSVLANGPLDAVALANRIEVNQRGARDFFDALVAMGLLTRDALARYQNTAESNHYLDQTKPTYLGASFEQYNHREYGLWGSLTRALQTGKPAAETNGQDHFESLYGDAARFQSFVRAMTSGSMLAAQAIGKQFPWEPYESLCDVGTAEGCLPVQLATAHPHIRAIGFDLPPLRPAFEAYAAEAGVANRVIFHGGSFFEDPLPTANVIVFGRVLHNWDLKTKKMLLTKAYEAIPSGGAVIVYDLLIDDDRRSATRGLLSSLNMLLWTAGGFGYTATECIDGILGYDFFFGHVVHLDYERERVEVLTQAAAQRVFADAKNFVVPAYFDEGVPLVPAAFGSASGERFLLDSGSPHLFVLTPFARAHPSEVASWARTTFGGGRATMEADYLEGAIRVAARTAPAFTLGPQRFDALRVGLEEPDDRPNAIDVALDAIVGTDQMKYFDWWFDYDGGRIAMRRNGLR